MTTFQLYPEYFTTQERLLLETDSFSARAFRFDSGVCGLRMTNAAGELVMLPFQGQQIWSASFGGRDLTMRSMFDQPYPTTNFLATFGGFLQHCGATAMGSPSTQDTHPLHGELPNAPYNRADLALGQDEHGDYLGLTGQYRHTVAFSYNYIAEPMVKLYSGSSRFRVSMTIENLKNTPMPLMYLAHINFRPQDHARLVYSAPCDSEHMRVRLGIPSHVTPKPGYREFLETLRLQPEKHLTLTPGLPFDPEVVLFIKYQADESGWATALQVHPDGRADMVRHRPDQLNHAPRWICRTADQDALGFEAGTAEVEGYLAEKSKGNLRELAAKDRFTCEIEIGALSPAEAAQVEKEIAGVLNH